MEWYAHIHTHRMYAYIRILREHAYTHTFLLLLSMTRQWHFYRTQSKSSKSERQIKIGANVSNWLNISATRWRLLCIAQNMISQNEKKKLNTNKSKNILNVWNGLESSSSSHKIMNDLFAMRVKFHFLFLLSAQTFLRTRAFSKLRVWRKKHKFFSTSIYTCLTCNRWHSRYLLFVICAISIRCWVNSERMKKTKTNME